MTTKKVNNGLVNLTIDDVTYVVKVHGQTVEGEYVLLPIKEDHLVQLKDDLVTSWRNGNKLENIYVNLHVNSSKGHHSLLVFGTEFVNNTPDIVYRGVSSIPGKNPDGISDIPTDVTDTLAILFRMKFIRHSMTLN